MNKILVSVVALVLIAVAGAVIFAMQPDESSQTADTSNHSPAANSGSHSESKQTETKPNNVTIEDYAFTPANLTVKKGTTVTWMNNDTAKHNVAAQPGKDGGGLPENAPLFGKGETFTHTFDRVGTFEYLCTPHPYMRATVTVTE